MPGFYEREITRRDPGCIVLLVDQSGSMDESSAGDPAISRAVAAADAANDLILEIVFSCQRGPGVVGHFLDLGVIGYGAGGAGLGWVGALRGRELISPAEAHDNHLGVAERAVPGEPDAPKGRTPVWLEPVAAGGAPMAEGLTLACEVLRPWVDAHRNSYPPLVLLITGGQADNVPLEAAGRLKSLGTDDGTVLLYSVYLATAAVPPALFPSTPDGLPDGRARALFEMVSMMPGTWVQRMRRLGRAVEGGARGLVVNADIRQLVMPIEFVGPVVPRDLSGWPALAVGNRIQGM